MDEDELKLASLAAGTDQKRMSAVLTKAKIEKLMQGLVHFEDVQSLIVKLRGAMTSALNSALSDVPQRAQGLEAGEIAALLLETKEDFEAQLSDLIEKLIADLEK